MKIKGREESRISSWKKLCSWQMYRIPGMINLKRNQDHMIRFIKVDQQRALRYREAIGFPFGKRIRNLTC